MKATWHLLPFCALLLGVCPRWAGAYKVMTAPQTGQQLTWNALPMKINIDQGAAPGLSAEATHDAIRKAYQTWADVSCSHYTFTDLGLVSLPMGNQNDKINTNSFPSYWPANMPGNALGVTQTFFDPYAGNITDADTLYNPNMQWSTTGGQYSSDVQSVATHEIGHQLGLDHSPEQNATMFYATGMGTTSGRSLHSDDIAGICYLYPSGTGPAPECTTAAQCGPNETCVNGSCISTTTKGYGSPCTAATDCVSGLCLQYGTDTFCSQGCDTQACPNGDQCMPVSGGGSVANACLPNSANQGTKELGEPCINNMDCKSDICVNVPSVGYMCSRQCNLQQPDCPGGYMCVQGPLGGGLCVPLTDGSEQPPGTKQKLGYPCSGHSDCESNMCIGGATGSICSEACNLEKNDCPDGYTCKSAGNGQGACDVDTANPPPGAMGATCDLHSECNSGMCAQDSIGNRFCTTLCDPGQGCASGYDCVSAGGGKNVCAPAFDTDDGGGGCALSGGPTRGTGSLLMLVSLLVLLLLVVRRE